MTQRMQNAQILGIFGLALFTVFGVLLGPTIIRAAAGVDAQINCFIGAQDLNAIIPFIYYGGIAMLAVGGVGMILRDQLKRGMMAITYGRYPRPIGAGVTAVVLMAMIVGILSLGSFAPWGFKGHGSLYAAETTCLLLDGSTAMTGNLNMGGNDIVNNANITSSGTSTAALFTGDEVSAGSIISTGDMLIAPTGNGDVLMRPDGSDVVYSDDTAVAMGTGTDTRLYYDGTDSFWDLRAVGAGDLMIAMEAAFPSPEANSVMIWAGNSGATTHNPNSQLILENDSDVLFEIDAPNDRARGIIFGEPSAGSRAYIIYYGSTDTPADSMEFATAGGTTMTLSGAASPTVAMGGPTSITTASGALTLNPSTVTDVSSDPLVIQVTSADASPGTTTDGQIRLWRDSDAGGFEGRILGQAGSITYQWNADAGLTFSNRPAQFRADKTRFAIELLKWRTDTMAELLAEYLKFFTDHGLQVNPAVPTASWTGVWFSALRNGYKDARKALPDDVVIPKPNSKEDYDARQPVPDPFFYRIADETINETLSARTGTQLDLGDSLVLQVDRVEKKGGDTLSIHTVPSSLEDEFIHLLTTDTNFRNRVQDILGIPTN